MLSETHNFIVREALKLTGKKFKGYEKFIEKGCIKEDHPSFTFDYGFQILGTDHFYHPIKKKGYFSFSGDAKKRGLSYFNKAVYIHRKGDKEEAFILLGKALHMLADTASPSHTKLEFHLVDIFEHYINNNIPHLKFSIKSKIIPRINPSHCFDRLAKKSFKVKFRKRFFLDILHMLGIKNLNKERHKQLHKISNKLISSTIIYSAVLLSLFYSKTNEKSVKNKTKEKIEKIRTKAKEIKQEIKDKSKKVLR
ncbi:zinc dependent phospholipase C family protein [Candidatus Woesearchaeota archaeon]|nr:zinc dependent phospholipase C family protein [Candidatus Woesearchaeota archaeon]